MLDFYIHQIGDMSNEKTYERMINILKSKCIASRGYMEKMGINYNYDNTSYELNIPKGKEWMYYTEDIHKNRVSLSYPHNHIIKKMIQTKSQIRYTCFDNNYIAFAISRDVPILPMEECHGIAIGEVQVKEKIDSEYIVGLVVPISLESMNKDENSKIICMLYEICISNDLPLNIYNYDGYLLKSMENNKKM